MGNSSGKIDRELVDGFIRNKKGCLRKEVRIGPGFGVDVSLTDLPGGLVLAATSDPLTLIPGFGLKESAWLSVHLMANDMATTGFAPMYGQFVLNLPVSFSQDDFKEYWGYIHDFCAKIGVAITGGHTGFIEGQHSTIAGGGTFFTIAPKDAVKVSSYARAGDSILITKSCAMSSAAILAKMFPKTVKDKAGEDVYHSAAESFYDTSSLKEALTVMKEHADCITAMHDVTEGGVLGAIYEMAVASGHGVLVYDEQLPISYPQKEVCSVFSLDPRYCIGAGSMVISCKKGSETAVIKTLSKEDISCIMVGKFTEPGSRKQLNIGGKAYKMKYYETDPYWAAFLKAMESGWK